MPRSHTCMLAHAHAHTHTLGTVDTIASLRSPCDTTYLHNDHTAAYNLARIALAVNLAETSPLTELLGIGHLDQVDAVLRAQGLDELDVVLLVQGLGEHAEMGLATVKGLGSLADATGQTVVDQGLLEHGLERLLNGKAA